MIIDNNRIIGDYDNGKICQMCDNCKYWEQDDIGGNCRANGVLACPYLLSEMLKRAIPNKTNKIKEQY